MNFVAAILYAVSTSSLLALVLAFLRGGLTPSSAATALAGGLLVASGTMWQGRHRSTHSRPPSAPEWLAITAFALVSLRIFLWLVFTQDDEIKVLSPNNLGDLSLHLTYIRYLANGVPFWPDNPIFTGGKLTYPIGVDLFHSLCVLTGMDVFRGFIWIGLAGAALTGVTLWRWGRGFALFGFLANGGLAGLAIFHTGQLADFQSELGWKSLMLALFATQRGLLFALPAGLLLLCSWRSRFFKAGDDDWRLPVWGEVLLYASLPLFHFHTFLFLSVLLGVWFLCHPPARLKVFLLVISSFVPATALVYLITGGLKGGHLLGWKAGWMWDDQSFLDWCQAHWHTASPWIAGLTFWPLNFGVLLIFVVLLVSVLSQRQRWPRWVVLTAAGIFFICSLVIFAPWDLDHTKLTIWSYPVILPTFWAGLLAQCTRYIQLPILVLTLVAVSCWPPRNSWPRLVVFPSLGIFFICCFVKFAPWEWDNTKLMLWSYVAILPFLWTELLAHWPRWVRSVTGDDFDQTARSFIGQRLGFDIPLGIAQRVLDQAAQLILFGAVGALFFSGFLSTLGGIDASDNGFAIATRSELDGVAQALRRIPVTDRFAGAPTYNHPILLNGRKMVLGYIGHVHSHGLAWEEPSAKLDALLNGEEGWQSLAAELGARYLFWGANEEEAYKDSTQPWKRSCRLVASGDWGAIYDLQSAPTGLPEMKE